MFYNINLRCTKDKDTDIALYVFYSTSSLELQSTLSYTNGEIYMSEELLEHYLMNYNIIDFNKVNSNCLTYADKVSLFVNLKDNILQKSLKEIVATHLKGKEDKKPKEIMLQACLKKANKIHFMTEIK